MADWEDSSREFDVKIIWQDDTSSVITLSLLFIL